MKTETSGVDRRSLMKLLGAGVAGTAVATGVSALIAPDSASAAGRPAASLAMKDRMWLTVGVRDFGAQGDGTTDDTSAIQDAIDHVAGLGGGMVTLPPGTYMTSAPVTLRDEVLLVGEGDASVIKAFGDHGWGNLHHYHGMIDVLGVTNTGILNLKIDQNGIGRNATTSVISYSVLVSGSENCEISNVTFVGQGLGDPYWPGGPALLIDSLVEASPTQGSLPGYDTKRILVSNCRFIQDPSLHLNFAIRVYTTFYSSTGPVPDPPAVSTTDVTIQNSYFKGLWGWNTIEFAGKTQYSKVIGCVFDGISFTHIDFDKGTSNCVAAFNMIKNAGKPPHLISNPNTRVAVINDHGAGTDDVRCNLNNVIAYNVVDHTVTEGAIDTLEAAIMVGAFTRNSQIIGNRISNVNNGQIGGGIQFQKAVNGAVVRDNVVTGVKHGIWFDPEFSDFDGLRIEDNTVDAEATAIYVNKKPGHGKDVRIVGNRATTNGDGAVIAIDPGTLEAPVIGGNTTEGGSIGYHLNGDNAIVINNVATGASQDSFQVGESATLIGNVSLSPGGNDLTVAAGAPQPRLSANSFTGPDADLSPTTSYAASPPTAGTWRRGDVVYNSAPSAGAPFAWSCVADGTPGEWKAVATIAN
jgi:hypothetical protein